jgi:hypothetical protein
VSWTAPTGVGVVASWGDRDSLLRAVDAEEPDVVVTDIRVPPPTDTDEGLQVGPSLRRTHSRVGGRTAPPGGVVRGILGATGMPAAKATAAHGAAVWGSAAVTLPARDLARR